MSKIIKINKEDFKVSNEEFNNVPHDEFNNLNILDSLGLFERMISLLKELSLLFDTKPSIDFFNITHGGYIPIKCANFFNNVFIHNTIDTQNDNIIINIYNHKKLNINVIDPSNLGNYVKRDIIFFNNKVSYINTITEFPESVIIFMTDSDQTKKNKHMYKLNNTDFYIYIPLNLYYSFNKEFLYYIEDDDYTLNYDNLIHYTMIVKNAGDNFEEILTKNLPIIDRWTILDTGSTDNTIDIINKVLVGKKKGCLYREPFINFKDSRNRCLDLAGKECKFLLMLDDTYIVDGDLRKFLNTVRGDQFSDTFSLFIRSDDVCYTSNRIIKSETGLRYIYKIHEVITPVNNINVIVPYIHSTIFDYRSDYMQNRTMDRKLYDIEVLFQELEDDPDDPRSLYYIGQTYNLLDKQELALEYYLKRVNHPVEGFLQEKIDACFESARMCNFHLNKPWEECEKLYLKSFEMDKTRSDALYFLGIHYYLETENEMKNKKIAYDYMKKCFELGYPEHCQYSLKPSLHFYFLPKFLAHLSYIHNDYITGKKCTDVFLEKNKSYLQGVIPFKECFSEMDYKTVKSWNDIFNILLLTPKNINRKSNYSKPLLVFMADGGFDNWTGKDILNKGVGGSETFTIEISRHIQASGEFQVIVFCRCSENDTFEGVEYRNLSEYFSFIFENNIHTCIIGRYSEYLPITIKSNVENIYMIAHDLDFTGNVIPTDLKLKNIFCLSTWHCEYFSEIYPTLKDIVKPFGYGIDRVLDVYDKKQKTSSFVFIYSSFPIRGLLPLLQMWPRILERYPGSILHIHSDVDGWWSNNMRPIEMKEIKELLSKYKNIRPINDSLKYHGWTSKELLYKNWKESDIWFYPCTYKETFCHTALEAAITKTFAITTDLAALKYTVGDRGILLNGDFYDLDFQNEALKIVFESIDNIELRRRLVEKNYKWVSENSWKNRANILLKEYLLPNLKLLPNKLSIQTPNKPSNITINTFSSILDYVKWKNQDKNINLLEVGGLFSNEFVNRLPKSKLISVESQIKITNNNILTRNGDITDILLDMIKESYSFSFIYINIQNSIEYYTNIVASFKLLNNGGILAVNNNVQFFMNKHKDKIKILSEVDGLIFIEKNI